MAVYRYIAAAAALSGAVSALPLEGEAAAAVDVGKRDPLALPTLPIKVVSVSSPTVSLPTVLIPGKPVPVTGTPLLGSTIPGVQLTAGEPVPSNIYNPNGPIYNPNDYTPLPFTWPGKPTSPQATPPPRPSKAPFQPGGTNSSAYQSPAWLTKGLTSLIPALSQAITNGVNSTWGLLNCPTLPPWLGGGKPPTACGAVPNTGVTRFYDLTIAYQEIAPDGVKKNGLTINGQYPGPLIEANWGDMIQVTVHNQLTDEGTALHWHGLRQNGTQFYDGVPAVSQCPIPPGGSLTYKFKADLYGTTWYHSHYSAQYTGGAVGPLVIHGPQTGPAYDVDIGPIMLSDWYHSDYYTLVEQTMNGTAVPSNNNLINGKMNYPCNQTTQACTPNAGISKFQFQSGKRYKLRLINTGAEGIQKFTIDGHNFTVIANDLVPIQPYNTSVITLGIGQRTDVIVQAVGQAGQAYWMRSNLGTLGAGCSVTDGVSPEAVAAVYYQGANTNALPTTQSGLTTAQLTDCGNDPLTETVAFCSEAVGPAATTETVTIKFASNGTNFVWFMNNSSFRGDYSSPTLLDVNQKNLNFEPEWNVYDFGTNTSVRLVVENTFQFSAHPMHVSLAYTTPRTTTTKSNDSFTATTSTFSLKVSALGTV
jgi:FtsP/CotA-like multicopper oxidase with cupredoxin domain